MRRRKGWRGRKWAEEGEEYGGGRGGEGKERWCKGQS